MTFQIICILAASFALVASALVCRAIQRARDARFRDAIERWH